MMEAPIALLPSFVLLSHFPPRRPAAVVTPGQEAATHFAPRDQKPAAEAATAAAMVPRRSSLSRWDGWR